MKRTLLSFLLFGTFFGSGFWYLVTHTSPFQMLRDPAAIPEKYDLSNLREDALQVALKEKIIRDFDYVVSGTDLELSVGHLYVPNGSGGKVSLCDQYKSVQMNFEVHGVVVNGDAPTMEVEGPCISSTDSPSRLESYLIPLASLPKEAIDTEIALNSVPNGHAPVRIAFKNMEPNLPNQWILVSIELKDEEGRTFHIRASDVRKHDPVLLKW